jgi:hypothetical protein
VPWQLSHWHLVRSLLQLDNLLINKLARFVNNNIWIHGALILSRHLLSITHPRERDACKTTRNGQNFDLLAVAALDMK